MFEPLTNERPLIFRGACQQPAQQRHVLPPQTLRHRRVAQWNSRRPARLQDQFAQFRDRAWMWMWDGDDTALERAMLRHDVRVAAQPLDRIGRRAAHALAIGG